jgi:lipoprotein-anchoring transpeptidase ErfK/SrfK
MMSRSAENAPDARANGAAMLAQGKAAARAGRKAEARYFLNAALETEPEQPEALLWLAYLAGGGQRSLTYLVRVLELDPDNRQAKAAIRWARSRARPRPGRPWQPRPTPAAPGHRFPGRWVAVLLVVALGLAVGLGTGAFVLENSAAEPTRALFVPLPTTGATAVALVTASPTQTASATPTPTLAPVLFPSHTPTSTETPSPTPSPTSSPTATATALPTPTATPTSPPATDTPEPTPTPVPPSATPIPTAAASHGARWIDVDLTNQRLIAYEGEKPVRWVTVSTGLPRTPTVTGRFKIYVKYRSAGMSGPGYNLPGVPYVMYFYRGYGLHGTYWHNNFGHPMSHGCVNLPTPEAEWLFNWASVGTPVVVHY